MKFIKAKVFILAVAMPVMFPSPASAQLQIYHWVTIAGLAGQSGSADGTNSAARFSGPGGMAVDSAGNLYVADQKNGTVRKLTPVGTNWVSSTIAGLAGHNGSADGTNSAIRFIGGDELGWVAVDSAGNVFVADWGNNTIRKLTPVGTNYVSSTIAGLAGQSGSADGTNSAARFNGPNDVALDSAGNLFVADFGNSTIRKLTPVGTNWVSSTIAGLAGHNGSADGTNSAARFNVTIGLAVDSGGNVYVADYANSTIRKLTPVGTNWVTSTIAGLAGHSGGADGTNSAARFSGPGGVAVDSAGNVYVADSANDAIRKLTPIGTNWVTSTIGGLFSHTGFADGTNSAARFNLPDGLRVDSAGNVYVAEGMNNTIRKGVPLPEFQSVTHTHAGIEFTWSATVGQRLQLQYNSDLTSTNWTNLGNTMTATNGTMSSSDTLGTDTTRFYRIILRP
jgi:sugar lactone lactonase YvrE